jgi:hypothetical protein
MNPSFNPKGMHSVAKKVGINIKNPLRTHLWSYFENTPEHIDESIQFGRHIHAEYAFFKRMHEIAQVCGTFFQHVDLFVYRQTNQNAFLKSIVDRKGELSPFGVEQLEIFFCVLEKMKPKVVVVSNAGASTILRNCLQANIQFSKKCGYHVLVFRGHTTPIFFSSMLTGQRALDTGSYERLVWHIQRAFSV